jgi:hypothetical protein
MQENQPDVTAVWVCLPRSIIFTSTSTAILFSVSSIVLIIPSFAKPLPNIGIPALLPANKELKGLTRFLAVSILLD